MTIRVKLDLDALVYEQLFEKTCQVRCKGLQQGQDQWIFIVPMGKGGKAIGSGAQNIRKLQRVLSQRNKSLQNLRIKIIEFHPNIKIFIKNIISPLQVQSIEVEGDVVKITDPSKKTKSLLIGPGASKLRQLNSILERFFHKKLEIQ
ncbi:hypothetical protein CL619_03630 [archaeon]|nr:hypothetical protein [archaeon]|tara:strand:+ start:328 stop:768 length:441 start_codon:yes stop_codon:yes gene_type:complete